jgi:secondary thiamine-phosphate synthase enzyme
MSLMQTTHVLKVETRGPGLYVFTEPVCRWVAQSGLKTGLLTLLIQHTSASLVIQENADPDVQGDLQRFFERLVPEGDPFYRHTLEGPDDMPAHVRSALTQSQLSIPVIDSRPALGTWQGLYVFEHRRAPQTRKVAMHLLGEG